MAAHWHNCLEEQFWNNLTKDVDDVLPTRNSSARCRPQSGTHEDISARMFMATWLVIAKKQKNKKTKNKKKLGKKHKCYRVIYLFKCKKQSNVYFLQVHMYSENVCNIHSNISVGIVYGGT